jgi:hypothetical protein
LALRVQPALVYSGLVMGVAADDKEVEEGSARTSD